MQTKKLAWLQALRGIAALLVVFVHARYYFSWTPTQNFANALMRPGAMGVDLFFLISGFIMVLTTADAAGKPREALRFLAKRIARIWPVYAVLAVLGIQAIMPLAYFADTAHLADFGKSLLFLPVAPYSPPFYGLPYGLGWTLNFEIYFYLVFGISMLAGRLRWPVFFGWLGISLIGLPLLAVGHFSLKVDHDYHFSLGYLNQATNPIIWVFGAGVAAGLLYRTRLSLADCLATRCLVCFLVAFALWWSYSGVSTIHGITEWGGPLAVALTVFALASKNLDIQVPEPLMWLGEVSFSLYLAHPVAQGIVTRILDGMRRHDLTQTWSHILFTTVLALVFAAISHALLERGLSEWVKARLLGWIDLGASADNAVVSPVPRHDFQ